MNTLHEATSMLKRMAGIQDEKRVAIEDWIGDKSDRRHVNFEAVGAWDMGKSGGKPWLCEVMQHRDAWEPKA